MLKRRINTVKTPYRFQRCFVGVCKVRAKGLQKMLCRQIKSPETLGRSDFLSYLCSVARKSFGMSGRLGLL